MSEKKIKIIKIQSYLVLVCNLNFLEKKLNSQLNFLFNESIFRSKCFLNEIK